jgi:hypothetical protein
MRPKDEAMALGADQVRRYHAETPELFVPQMVFTATEAIGFAYGVTWNLIRRNIFNWKHTEKGNLEAKAKSFCSPTHEPNPGRHVNCIACGILAQLLLRLRALDEALACGRRL